MPACSTLGNSRVTPHPPPVDSPAPRTHKPGSPSVVLQLGAWIAAIAGLAVVSILASITVAELSSGEARAINLAGSLRMQSYVIRAAAGPARHDPAGMEQAIAEFELRYRSPELQQAIPRWADDPVRLAYEAVGAVWVGRFRPAALQAWGEGPNSPSLQVETMEMVSRIDHLVALVEESLESKLQWLRLVQGISLILLLMVGAATVQQLKTRVLRPLDRLLDSARRVQRGDFSVRLPPGPSDELGQLGEAFNFMVEDLSCSYARLESRVQEKTEALARSNHSLMLLYRTTRALSERAVTRATLQQVLQDVVQVIGVRTGAVCLGKPGEADIATEGSGPLPVPVRELCAAACQGCEKGGSPTGTSPPVAGAGKTISVPLFDGTRSHGAMILIPPDQQALEAWQIELLETVGRHVGAALASTQRSEERHRLALLDERSVIARELHDSLAQSLSYLKIQVTRLQTLLGRTPPPAPVNEIVGELRDGLNEAYRQLRELLTTFRLRIDGRGLNAAIDDTVQEFRRRTGLEITLENGLSGFELAANREIHVLQIIREALSNIERHAQARKVAVSLTTDGAGHVQVSVDDDGIGFDDTARPLHRYGIVIMRDRAQSLAGELTVLPREGGGTRVELHIPAATPLQEPTQPAQGGVA